MSTKILFNEGRILSANSVTISGDMRRRQSVKEILTRKVKESGLSVPDICRRASEKGYKVSVSAVKFILNGATKNPQLFTIEAIAHGLDLSPLALIAEVLGDRSEDPAFKAGQFAVLADAYKEIPAPHRSKADPFVDGLLLQLKHIKSQAK